MKTTHPSRLVRNCGRSCLSVFALLTLMSLPSERPAFAQCATTRFQPPVSAINVPVPLDASPSKTQNGRTLTRSESGNTVNYSVTRPNRTPFAFPPRTRPLGATQFLVEAAFIGANGVLFRVFDSDGVNANHAVFFFDLSAENPVEVTLFTRQLFTADSAVPFFFQNSDGSCLFVDIQSNRSGELQHDVFVMTVFRMDIGAAICTHPSTLSDRGDLFSASIIQDTTAPVEPVRILRDRRDFADIEQACALPVPDLTVQPRPLAFGCIPIGASRETNVTFVNSGQEPMCVDALGSRGPFAPVNFAPFTLQIGEARNVTIRFTAPGPSGNFVEDLPITRRPAFGASSVRCTGCSRPVVTIAATDATASEPGTDTGRFTVTRTGSTANPLIVRLSAPTGSATFGVDYTTQPTTLTTVTIPSGSLIARIDVFPQDDVKDEFDETVTLAIAPDNAYLVGTSGEATLTIVDNDPLPIVSVAGLTVVEGDKGARDASFVVRLSAASGKPVRVQYRTLGGTATGGLACGVGTDYVSRSGTLEFPPDQNITSRTINVLVCGDLVREFGESFNLELFQLENASFSGNAATITTTCSISDNDLIAGTFDLVPSDQTVAIHERLNYAYTWTVPEPLNWHDLESLQLRIRDDDEVILSLLFDEATQAFVLLNQATGEFTDAGFAGNRKRLQTPEATLYLADTTVVGSGPTGPSVTLNLSLSFKPKTSGRTFAVEVAATDDLGNQDDFAPAGTLTVLER